MGYWPRSRAFVFGSPFFYFLFFIFVLFYFLFFSNLCNLAVANLLLGLFFIFYFSILYFFIFIDHHKLKRLGMEGALRSRGEASEEAPGYEAVNLNRIEGSLLDQQGRQSRIESAHGR